MKKRNSLEPATGALIACLLVIVVAVATKSGFGQTPSGTLRDDPAGKLFNDAEALRNSGRTEEAIGRYQRIAAEYPASLWAARSVLEAARALVAAGKWEPAMKQMQDVRVRFPKTREAAEALDRNTILHRLRLRQGQPAFRYARTAVSGGSSNVRRVLDLAVDSENRVYIAMRKSVVVFNDTGALVRTVPGDEYRAVAIRGNTPVLFEERGVRELDSLLVPMTVPDQNRQREVDIQSGAVALRGLLVIADRRTKAIHRLLPNAGHDARLAALDAVRIAAGPHGELAAIERETRALLLIAPDGTLRRVPAQAPGYQLRGPVDLVFDLLGHLYVLEPDSVIVFAPTGELLALFAASNATGAFRMGSALDVDPAGRLYVYDEETERVQVYH